VTGSFGAEDTGAPCARTMRAGVAADGGDPAVSVDEDAQLKWTLSLNDPTELTVGDVEANRKLPGEPLAVRDDDEDVA